MKNLLVLLLISCLSIIVSCSSDSDTPESNTLTVTDFETSVDEVPESGAVLGTIEATTESGDITLTIVSQSPSGAIVVGGSTGEISVANPCLFDFSDNPQITAIVEVSNGSETKQVNITININDPGTSTFTIWVGDKITFTKADGADPAQEANQDRITDNVWITRSNGGGQIYNAKVETWSESIKNSAPADTEWARGTTSDIKCLSFGKFRDIVSPKDVVGVDLVLHLITDDVYLDVEFTQWSQGMQGGFAYERSSNPD